jgi:hypothetical protein
MKGVYREKLFYGIQHLENFLLIFFLVPHRAVPDLQRMKRPFSDAIFFYIWRPSRMFYALVSIQTFSRKVSAMTWFQIYALFGSPVVLVMVALAVVWITGIQDRSTER